MYYAQQKMDRDIKSLSVTSYDTLPPEPEIYVTASTSQEGVKPPSKPDQKEAKEPKKKKKKKDQEKARMQNELNKEERPK